MASSVPNTPKIELDNVGGPSVSPDVTSPHGKSTEAKIVHRSRTGCLTCRTRKIRCDETKPACDRCKIKSREVSRRSCLHPPRPLLLMGSASGLLVELLVNQRNARLAKSPLRPTTFPTPSNSPPYNPLNSPRPSLPVSLNPPWTSLHPSKTPHFLFPSTLSCPPLQWLIMPRSTLLPFSICYLYYPKLPDSTFRQTFYPNRHSLIFSRV